ncbi:MAG: endo-1,4-beta-xylanase [Candidatus Sumerlaeia bacterium]
MADDKKEPTDQERIEQHRMGDITILADPGTEIEVRQLRHAFHFGTAISRKMWEDDVDPEDQAQYLKILKENFNAAVPENAGKWYHIERKPGQYRYEDLDRMLAWCEENDIDMRGHCVYWAVPKYVQDWIKELDNETLRAKVHARAFDLMSYYKGRIDEWDVNNEMLHGHFFEQRLGAPIRYEMFRWCRDANPDAVLYMNDYDILKGKDLKAYVRQIKDLKSIGAPVGGIGVQGHFWGGWFPEDKVRESFEELAKLKLPIKVTEFDFGHEDADKEAEVLEKLYTIAFAEPQVEAVLMWGFWEGRHWRDDGAAPWAKDWTATPSARAYRKLVFEKWWTNWKGQTDDAGKATLRAYYGRHEITANGQTRTVEFPAKSEALTIDLRK